MIRESLIWSDYQFYEEKQSQIDSLKTIRVEAGFGCPHCRKVVHKPVTIRHGETFIHHCGLKITVYGNSAECELETKK